jgi:Zn-dependent peptidase ImmA (M78 family)
MFWEMSIVAQDMIGAVDPNKLRQALSRWNVNVFFLEYRTSAINLLDHQS